MKDISLQSTDIQKTELQFRDLVSKAYLKNLNTYDVVPHALEESREGDIVPSKKNGRGYRWIKITNIVYNKEEFFIDKFSMLFVALHGVASQVAVMIKRDISSTVDFYLGVHDLGDKGDESINTLKKGLSGYFPGIEYIDNVPTPVFPDLCQHVSSVSGIATLKNEDKENFVQGIERLINATQNSSFTALIIADRLDSQAIIQKKNAYEDLYCNLAPFQEKQFSINSQISESLTNTLTNSFSFSTTNTVGKTITTGINTSEGAQIGKGSSENAGISIILSFGESTNKNTGINSQIGHHRDIADTLSEAIQKAETKAEAETKGYTKSQGNSFQISLKNRKVTSFLEILDNHIQRLNKSMPFGLWSCATYFISDTETRAKSLANIYRGSIVGENSYLEECVINSWNNQEVINYLADYSHPIFKYPDSDIILTPGSIVDSKELAIHLSLPQTSVPGISVKERSAFGRNVIKFEQTNSEIELGNILHLGHEDSSLKVKIATNELCKHSFITGTTGSGKSNTLYLLINDLVKNKNIPCLIIEPTKGEYKNVFGNIENNGEKLFDVYGSNPRFTNILRINPFEFPQEEVHVYEHIDRLVDIFNACWPMYAAMPVVLKKSICDAYEKCGWDLIKSEWTGNKDKRVLYPTIKDVVFALRDFMNNSEYSEDTKGDYKGSIETRLISLSEGLTGMMLNNPTDNLTNEQLFNNNVIIDLSKIGNSETKSLIMGLLIAKMTEYYQSSHHPMNSDLRHVTVLEEAHNILKRTSTVQSQDNSNISGKAVEMLCSSIAEMRTYGEGFMIVDQSPSLVDLAAIRNTNTKIIMSLHDYDDRIIAGKSIGLSDNQIEEIGNQKVGQAIIYQNDWEMPVQCAVTKFENNQTFIVQPDEKCAATISTNNSDIEIVKFLISGRLNSGPRFDLNKIVNYIDHSTIPSSIKFTLYKLVDEFNEMGFCRIWKDENFKELSSLVSSYINKEEKVQSIMLHKQYASSNEITNSIAELLAEDLSDLTKGEICTVIQCLLRHQSTKSIDLLKIYDKWKNS